MMPVGFISRHYSCDVRANLCTHRKLRWFLFNKVFSPLHVYFHSAVFVLGHLLKADPFEGGAAPFPSANTDLWALLISVSLPHTPLQPQQTPTTFAQTHLTLVSWIRMTPGRSGVDPHPTCSASSFRCPHILMQSLEFRTAALKFGIIQTCHSASHLILKHYHTNTAKRTKGSQLVLGINLSNSQSKPLAPQACRGFQ